MGKNVTMTTRWKFTAEDDEENHRRDGEQQVVLR